MARITELSGKVEHLVRTRFKRIFEPEQKQPCSPPPPLAFCKPFDFLSFFFHPLETKTGVRPDGTWLGSVSRPLIINSSPSPSPPHTPAPLAACAQRTHSSQSGHHEEGRWGAEEGVGWWWRGDCSGGTLQLKGIFFNGSISAGVEGCGRTQSCLSFAVSTRPSDKSDSVLTG